MHIPQNVLSTLKDNRPSICLGLSRSSGLETVYVHAGLPINRSPSVKIHVIREPTDYGPVVAVQLVIDGIVIGEQLINILNPVDRSRIKGIGSQELLHVIYVDAKNLKLQRQYTIHHSRSSRKLVLDVAYASGASCKKPDWPKAVKLYNDIVNQSVLSP